jgi:mRNA interferase MazF
VTKGKVVLVPFPSDLMESDFVIDAEQDDFVMTGLQVSSTLRLHRLMTVTTSLIERELGSISSGMENKVDEKLRKLFKLA